MNEQADILKFKRFVEGQLRLLGVDINTVECLVVMSNISHEAVELSVRFHQNVMEKARTR